MSVLWKMAAHWKGAAGYLAQLAIQRLFPRKLVLDLAAMAIGLVLDVELLVVLVYTVRGALLPLGDPRRRLAASLVLVHGDGSRGKGSCAVEVRSKQSGAREC